MGLASVVRVPGNGGVAILIKGELRDLLIVTGESLRSIAPADQVDEAAALEVELEALLVLDVLKCERGDRSTGALLDLVQGLEAAAVVTSLGAGLCIEEEHLGVTHVHAVVDVRVSVAGLDGVLVTIAELHVEVSLISMHGIDSLELRLSGEVHLKHLLP